MRFIILLALAYFGWVIIVKIVRKIWHLVSFEFISDYFSNLKVNKAYPLLQKFSKEQELFDRDDFRDYLGDRNIILTDEELTKAISRLILNRKIKPLERHAGTWRSTYKGSFNNPINTVHISLD